MGDFSKMMGQKSEFFHTLRWGIAQSRWGDGWGGPWRASQLPNRVSRPSLLPNAASRKDDLIAKCCIECVSFFKTPRAYKSKGSKRVHDEVDLKRKRKACCKIYSLYSVWKKKTQSKQKKNSYPKTPHPTYPEELNGLEGGLSIIINNGTNKGEDDSGDVDGKLGGKMKAIGRGGGGSKIEEFLKRKKPKSTLFADNTQGDNNKTNKAQPVAFAAPHPITPAYVKLDCFLKKKKKKARSKRTFGLKKKSPSPTWNWRNLRTES